MSRFLVFLPIAAIAAAAAAPIGGHPLPPIEQGVKISDFTIKNVPKLVGKHGDAWAKFFDCRQELKLK